MSEEQAARGEKWVNAVVSFAVPLDVSVSADNTAKIEAAEKAVDQITEAIMDEQARRGLIEKLESRANQKVAFPGDPVSVSKELLREAASALSTPTQECPTCGRPPGSPSVGPSVTRGGQHTNDVKRCPDSFHAPAPSPTQEARGDETCPLCWQPVRDDATAARVLACMASARPAPQSEEPIEGAENDREAK